MEKSQDNINIEEEMAPKNQPEENLQPNTGGIISADVDEEDIAEIVAVNDSLDSLNSALDTIEAKTDVIKARLLELLNSNKEIRQSIIAENSQREDPEKDPE